MGTIKAIKRQRIQTGFSTIESLIPAGEYRALIGYTGNDDRFHVLIAPLPLVELRERCPFTNKNKIQGQEQFTGGDINELKEKINDYIRRTSGNTEA